jgi:hypothetical protein
MAGGRVGKRKRPSGKVAFKPRGKKQVKDKEVFKRRKYARNNYVIEKTKVCLRFFCLGEILM